MAHVAIASDLHGSIFTIDHSGDLYRNVHAEGSADGPLLHPGLGLKIGSGWGRVHNLAAVLTDARIVLVAVADGALVAAEAALTDAGQTKAMVTPQPLPAFPAPVAGDSSTAAAASPVSFPPLRSVFPGAIGTFYLVSSNGSLLRQALDRGLPAGAPISLSVPYETVEAAGWADGMSVFTNGDRVFFEHTVHGSLRYQTVSTPSGVPSSTRWLPLATAWSRYLHVFAASARALYVVDAEGALELRPFSVSSAGDVTLEKRRSEFLVGSGLFPWAGLSADIEGYTWPLSYQPGDSVSVKVGTRLSLPPAGVPIDVAEPAHYTVDVRRLRRMSHGIEANYDAAKPTTLTGQTFLAPQYLPAPDLMTNGAGWADSFSFAIPDLPHTDPDHWRSGLYAARCTDSQHRDFYVSFVVRNKHARSPFAVIANSNTWNAYNSWGGQGKYTHTYPVPETLPFLRPHPGLTPDPAMVAPGLTQYGPSVLTNSCHLLRAELWVLGWLEDLRDEFGDSYAYDLYTDQDLHSGIAGIGDGADTRYRGLILNTHPEYWTREMYDHVKAYRDQGGSIVYLGGNGIYEEVVPSQDGKLMGIFPGVDRSKFPSTCTNEQLRLYCLMRTPAVNRPEAALLGVGFVNYSQAEVEGQPYLLLQEPDATGSNSALHGVELHQGQTLGKQSVDLDPPKADGKIDTYHADGWEVDQRGYGTPPSAYAINALLARGKHVSSSGEMLCFDAEAGGVVFAGSSLNFGGSLAADINLQRIVRNVLDECLRR